MNETVFDVPKMDCPSEENVIRMTFRGNNQIRKLSFDLQHRSLTVTHLGEADSVLRLLEPLGFGAKIKETKTIEDFLFQLEDNEEAPKEAIVLKQLLAINGTMFVLEIGLGWWAQSAGLIADSLDMLADAAVYGLSLYAVGKTVGHQKRAARLSGYMQLILAVGTLLEVTRRAFFGSEPEGTWMMIVSFIALIANVSCLLLISKHREGGAHMKASWIFSTNDVIANMGVILAGGLVYLTSSHIPDLVIGALIAILVFRGALQILKLSRVGT